MRYNLRWFKWSFVEFLKLIICFVVPIFDIVHDVEAIFSLPLLLTASGNHFWNMSDTGQFEVSRASLIFQKKVFQMLLAVEIYMANYSVLIVH